MKEIIKEFNLNNNKNTYYNIITNKCKNENINCIKCNDIIYYDKLKIILTKRSNSMSLCSIIIIVIIILHFFCTNII